MRIVIVDTPGFDDSERSDSTILRTLTTWLESSYRKGSKLTGIIYLHPISNTRMQGSTIRNLHVFKRLVGEESFRNVVLATTFWDTMASDMDRAEEREAELQDDPAFWGGMILKGADYKRCPTTRVGAKGLLRQMGKRQATALNVQKEIVDQQRSFEETTANEHLEEELRRVNEDHERQLAVQTAEFEAEMEAKRKAEIREKDKAQQEYEKKLQEQEAERLRIVEEQRKHEEEQKRIVELRRKQQEEMRLREAEAATELVRIRSSTIIEQRRRYAISFVEEVKETFKTLKAGQSAGKVICKFEPVSRLYTRCCDNCLDNIGGEEYFSKFMNYSYSRSNRLSHSHKAPSR